MSQLKEKNLSKCVSILKKFIDESSLHENKKGIAILALDHLQQVTASGFNGSRADDVQILSTDQQFMRELQALVEDNLSNPDLDIELMAQKLYISRSTLKRKIKALTGQSAGRFVRSYRLKRAAQLLKAKFGNVTEVAFEVGFSSSAYFTKCFKEQFRQAPHDYRNSKSMQTYQPQTRMAQSL